MITDLSTKSVFKCYRSDEHFRELPTRRRQNSTGTNWRHWHPVYSQAVTHLVQYAVTQASWNGRDSSVRPSVCPVDRQQQRRPAGLLLSAGSRYRSIAALLPQWRQREFKVGGRALWADCPPAWLKRIGGVLINRRMKSAWGNQYWSAISESTK